MNIGVFDSGVGGKSVANAIEKAMPELKIIYVNDRKNVPYGDKTPQELLKLVTPILIELSKTCDVIVVACNTVSTTLINELRNLINVPLIAMEPMVKPAAEMTKNNVIAVCATPATLKSTRYAWLKDEYAAGIKIIEPDCSDWSNMIESNQIDRKKIEYLINNCIEQDADVIVLGCTHYHWIEKIIKDIASDRAIVIQPEQAIVRQLKSVISRL